MKAVHCKECGEVIGYSDGQTFFDGFKPVDQLPCKKCGKVRKLFGRSAKPLAIDFNDFNLQIRLT
jgi:hypothetical protein